MVAVGVERGRLDEGLEIVRDRGLLINCRVVKERRGVVEGSWRFNWRAWLAF